MMNHTKEICSSETMTENDHWYGNKSTSDVIVSLVQISKFDKEITLASLNFDSAMKDENNSNTNFNVSKKRKRNSKNKLEHHKPNLGDLHVHSHQLRYCSKYFDTCLSERWAKKEVESDVGYADKICLSLDVHTNVKYYKECFSCMYSSNSMDISNIKHCLKLLKVATQISYEELIKACVSYLESIPWSLDDEKKIRRFAKSLNYPFSYASDLNARLGLPMSSAKIHNDVLNMMHELLQSYFDNAMKNPYCGEFEQILGFRQMFSSAFSQILIGSYQILVNNILKHVNDGIKTYIGKVEHQYDMLEEDGLYNLRWILNILLDTRCAKEIIEYIIEESTLESMFRKHYGWRWWNEWFDVILLIFKESNEGHLLLKPSTRYNLLQQWSWILALGSYEDGENRAEVRKVLSAFITTFPYKIQKEIFSIWLKNGPMVVNHEPEDLYFKDIHEDWIFFLQERIMSLEPGQLALHQNWHTIASSSSSKQKLLSSNPCSSLSSNPTSPCYNSH